MLDLSAVPVFQGVSAAKLALLTTDMVRYFTTGAEIVREGNSAVGLIVLLHGQARVSAAGTYIVSRKAGEIIGEQAIVEGTPHSATVVAQGMVEALMVPRRIVDRLFEDPAFVRNLAKALSVKLREATAERAIRYSDEERLFAEFSVHVAPDVASRLLATGTSYGDPRFIEAAVLMADIRSFTGSCARMEPRQIADELSRYLDVVVEVIHRHGGFVDKFIGDAVLAVWGVAPGDENLASKALACAREMVKAAATLRFGGASIQIGVGLNHGRVFVGNIGGSGKRQFTVLGSPVNLAERFESECKVLGVNIVAGEAFYLSLPESAQADLHRHEVRFIKGAGELAVYSWSAERVARLATPGERGNI